MLYTIIQFGVFLCYMVIAFAHYTKLRYHSRESVEYGNFIFWCGMHHLGCITMWIDMPHHAMHAYSGSVGLIRLAFDLPMQIFSAMTAWRQGRILIKRQRNGQ